MVSIVLLLEIESVTDQAIQAGLERILPPRPRERIHWLVLHAPDADTQGVLRFILAKRSIFTTCRIFAVLIAAFSQRSAWNLAAVKGTVSWVVISTTLAVCTKQVKRNPSEVCAKGGRRLSSVIPSHPESNFRAR